MSLESHINAFDKWLEAWNADSGLSPAEAHKALVHVAERIRPLFKLAEQRAAFTPLTDIETKLADEATKHLKPPPKEDPAELPPSDLPKSKDLP